MEPAVGIEPTTHGLQNRCSAAELSRLNCLSINCLRWNLLWIDRCNAYQKTTNKRPSNAINTSIVPRLNPSANTKLRRHTSSERIRDEFPIVRTVQRRNGVLAYRVDCRSKGWIGQAIYEYPTRKQALEQARKIAEAVKARGVDTTSSAIVFQDTGELSEWNTQLATHGKTLKDAVQFYLNHLDTEAKRSQSLTGRPLARLTGWCTASPGRKPLTGSL